ncbi:hypothetical protein K6Y31_08200, partial [Motilimonas cestriensis]
KQLNKLMSKPFACEEDANLAVDEFKKQSELLGFEQTSISKAPRCTNYFIPKLAAECRLNDTCWNFSR